MNLIITLIMLATFFGMQQHSGSKREEQRTEVGIANTTREKREALLGLATATGLRIADWISGHDDRLKKYNISLPLNRQYMEHEKGQKKRTKRTLSRARRPGKTMKQNEYSDDYSCNDMPLFAGFRTGRESRDVHFRQLGFTAITTEFAHVKFRFNLTDTLTSINRIIDAAESRAWHIQSHAFEKREYEALIRQAASLHTRAMALKEHAIPPQLSHRQKRFGATVMGIGIIVSLLTGLFNLIEVKDLNSRSNGYDSRIHALAEAEEHSIIALDKLLNATKGVEGIIDSTIMVLESRAKHETKIFWLGEAIQVAERQLMVTENGLRSAVRGHLDTAALTTVNLTGITAHLHGYAREQGLVFASEEHAHLQNMPTSLNPTDYGFDVFVHIPLFKPESKMKIFQHLPLPLPLEEGVFLMIDTPEDTIAISGDDSKYRITSITELNADCYKLGNFYACPRGNHAIRAPREPPTRITDDPGLCLWALLKGEGPYATKTCRRSIVQPGPRVVQVSARKFITYGATKGNIVCRPPRSLFTPFETTDFGTFHLPPGCYAHSHLFSLASADSAYTRPEEEWTTVSTLPIPTKTLLDEVDVSDIKEVMRHAKDMGQEISRISLEDAKIKITEAKKRETYLSWWPQYSYQESIGSMSGIIAFLMASLHLLYTGFLRWRRGPVLRGFRQISAVNRREEVREYRDGTPLNVYAK